MGFLTFKIGGIHPPENKITASSAIIDIELPSQVVVSITQHIGSPAKAQVKKGDFVKVGQLLAKGDGFISANIHSPVSGVVVKIEPRLDASGFRKESIIIEVKEDEWESDIDCSSNIIKECNIQPSEIIEKINNMGIVGLGGATFPSYIKYMIPEGKKVDYLIINGVECEPYLTSDHRLMIEKSEEIMIGISIMMKALNIEKSIIGIENNKSDAIEKLKNLASKYKGIEVKALKVKYPQGGEKQLIYALLKRTVPSGKLPIEVGCVVNNIGTAFAVYEAIQKNKPLIERIVTITGTPIKKPSNIRVRIGTPVSHLLKFTDCEMDKAGKIISGGPMMGKSIINTDIPITKGTSGILVFEKEKSRRIEVQHCIRCGKCTSVCPMGLEPQLLSILARQGQDERCQKESIMDCIECGSCVYTCPSGRPLLDNIRLGKINVGTMIKNKSKK